jgi:hypothetical protein
MASTREATPLGISLDASDPEFDDLSFIVVDPPDHGTLDDCSLGFCTYTPATNPSFVGEDTFTWKANDGVSDSNIATFAIDVTANAVPAATDQSEFTSEGNPLSILLIADDADFDQLTYQVLGAPVEGALDPSDCGNGFCTYTPDPGFVGTDTFTWSANDGIADSNTATFTITVTENVAPVATDQAEQTREHKPVQLALQATDVDFDVLTFAVVDEPTNGSLDPADCVSGTCTYTPNTGFVGADSFTWRASDGIANSNVATVTITITENSPPVAEDSEVEAFTATAQRIDLTANDSDFDTLTFEVVAGPSHGTLGDCSAGSCDYTSDAGYVGPDSFTWRASDGLDQSNVATVSITVLEPPDFGLFLLRPSPGAVATFVGHGGYSADGLGQPGPGGVVSADIPANSTVVHAYLYGSYNSILNDITLEQRTLTFDGAPFVLQQLIEAPLNGLRAARADVTDAVAAKVGSGGGVTDFVVDSDPGGLDGVALVVIYENPASPELTVAVLDGGADQAGDAITFNFAQPLDTTVPGFSASMSLGIGFSFQGSGEPSHECGNGPAQSSVVKVNGTNLTSCAGNYDDGEGNNDALITVGGVGDSLSNPSDPDQLPGDGTFPRTEDDELYDIEPFLEQDDGAVVITTSNPSGDDLIFLAVIAINAEASVTTEICDDGIDNDGDDLIDEADPDCVLAPTVDAGGPYTGTEGQAVALDATLAAAPGASVSWSADTSALDAGASCSFSPGPASVDATVSCTDDGAVVLSLTVDDGVNPPVTDTASLSLANADPGVDISTPLPGASIALGSGLSLEASVTDAGTNDTHTCSIDWGDGTPPEAGSLAGGVCSAAHTYAATGEFTITVSADDDDGGTGTDSVTISVTEQTNEAPIPDAGPNRAVSEGGTITLNATVTDPEGDLVTVTWAAAPLSGVDAGATCTFGGADSVDRTVTCSDDGQWTLTISAIDPSNPTPTTDTMVLTVTNAAPAVTAFVAAPPAPGADYQPGEGVLVSSTIADPGTNDTHQCLVTWGDGTSWSGPATGGGCMPPPHPYASNGTYNARSFTIVVRATDDDGASGTDAVAVQIDPCTRRGTSGNDTLVGTAGDDVLCGLGGDDVLNGQGGADVLVGGSGSDTASFLGSPAGVTASLTSNTATGWGSDALDGIENLRGSAHADLLIGNAAVNLLWGESGADDLRGLDGADTIEGADGADVLAGGNNADTLRGENGNDVLNGGPGNDAIGGGPGADDITAGDGVDSVFGGDGGDVITGGNGNDVLRGEAGPDVINGGADRDTITGGPDADQLAGGDDADAIGGGDGNDVVQGDDGNDDISGDDGSDLVNGGNDHDVMYGGLGEDILLGGSGNDDIAGDVGKSATASQGDEDHINGGPGDDLLLGQGGNDCSNLLSSHSQCPTVGTIDRDPSFRAQIQGGTGKDRLHGGPGSDRLDGGPEDENRLVGGTGAADFCSFGPAPRGDQRDRSCELPSMGDRTVQVGGWKIN